MSIILKTLESNRFAEHMIFPKNLKIKNLVTLGEDVLTVVGILKPEDNVNTFYCQSYFKQHITKFLPEIPSIRNEFFIFLMGYDSKIILARYHPLTPLIVLYNPCNKDDVELGFQTWLVNFSIDFVTKDHILKWDIESFSKFISSFPEGDVRDELIVISSLCSLRYR